MVTQDPLKKEVFFHWPLLHLHMELESPNWYLGTAEVNITGPRRVGLKNTHDWKASPELVIRTLLTVALGVEVGRLLLDRH